MSGFARLRAMGETAVAWCQRAVSGAPSASLALPAHLRGQPAFEAAVRHSAHVQRFRRAIPALAGVTLLALVARSLFILMSGPGASVEAVSIQGRKIVMEKPKLSGFKHDGRSYEMTATSATQDLKSPNIVDLDTLKARMQTGNDGWADMTGLRGTYDSKAEKLNVSGEVQVKTDSGMDARLQDAQIEFKSGAINTSNPVEVKMPQGVIDSNSMKVIDNGRHVIFEGRVRSVFQNAPAEGQTSSDEAPLEKPAPAPQAPEINTETAQ